MVLFSQKLVTIPALWIFSYSFICGTARCDDRPQPIGQITVPGQPAALPDPDQDESWLRTLPHPPGSSLKDAVKFVPEQEVTLFELQEVRDVQSSSGMGLFVSGKGYVTFDGGGQTLAGLNRSLDPFVEVTIQTNEITAQKACKELLTPTNLNDQAIRVSGKGHFARMPGIGNRALAVVLLTSELNCTKVPRR